MKRFSLLLASVFIAAQLYSQSNSSKVVKEEALKSKDHDKQMYLLTFKDGLHGKLCESPGGEWWIHQVIGKDKGPFTKKEATAELYSAVKSAANGAQALGGAIAGSIQKDKTKRRYHTDHDGSKYYLDDKNNRVYVK